MEHALLRVLRATEDGEASRVVECSESGWRPGFGGGGGTTRGTEIAGATGRGGRPHADGGAGKGAGGGVGKGAGGFGSVDVPATALLWILLYIC